MHTTYKKNPFQNATEEVIEALTQEKMKKKPSEEKTKIEIIIDGEGISDPAEIVKKLSMLPEVMAEMQKFFKTN